MDDKLSYNVKLNSQRVVDLQKYKVKNNVEGFQDGLNCAKMVSPRAASLTFSTIACLVERLLLLLQPAREDGV
jgi:hypothetical protein